jgi:Phosphoserine phosphatase RsbU, N-terminal domain
MSPLDRLRLDYRAAFLRYLPRHEETALARGYEIGRVAVEQGVSVLDLAHIHHDVLLEVLGTTRPEDLADVATGASQFLVEVLATYDMTQRAFLAPGQGADQVL